MESIQKKKTDAVIANTMKITDFFKKPTSGTVASASAAPKAEKRVQVETGSSSVTSSPIKPREADPLNTDSHEFYSDSKMDLDSPEKSNPNNNSNIPLFDPTDDHDDHLMDEDIDLTEDLSALDELKASIAPVSTKAVPCESALESKALNPYPPLLKKSSSKALVFEGDDDDFELLMNTSYDFALGIQNDIKEKEKPSAAPVEATPTERKRLTKKADLLESILGGGFKRAATTSKHTYSLDSLLKDKIKREKQIQEANDIESLLDAAENPDENSNPDYIASKLLPELIGGESDLSVIQSAGKKRKTRDSVDEDEEDEDIVEKEDEDDEDSPSTSKKSDYAVRENKKRLQGVVLGMMKTGTVDHLAVFDSIEVEAPHISLRFECPANDKIDTTNCQEFLLSGALSRAVENSNWYFPDSLSSWLFETACYSQSEFTASSAAKSLNVYFEHFSAEEGTCWTISPYVLKDALASFGFSVDLFSSDARDITTFVKSLSKSKQSNEVDEYNNYKLPAFNFSLCVELYTSSITNRWMHYPDRSLEDAFILLVKLSIDKRVIFATGNLLGKSVAKIARLLACQESASAGGIVDTAPSSFQYIVQNLVDFAGTNPIWQDALICKPNSAFLGSIAAPTSSGCPTRQGLGFLARVRREVAALCVVKGGATGGFKKLDSGVGSADFAETPITCETDTSLPTLVSIVTKYNVSPARTDYMRLASRIQILAVALGGYSGIRENLKQASELKLVLDRLHGNINDTSHLAMDRIWAKENIHDLKTYIELNLPKKTMQQSSIDSFLKS
ncbi:UNVERIFIED_CONTAM: hypothetical protein HDU68_000711 [Siphonaria sp. JEL0065]|nr:hypothetical protein HDU68_000711 [Siphonaria sp. JEL0065]